jgi:mannose-6-phosphate isomerase-like protein (cupin superfamily)
VHTVQARALSVTATRRENVMVHNAKRLPEAPDTVAPDGSDVRVLLAGVRGSMAHFELAPGATSVAVHHRTVEELWYFVAGHGQMWLRDGSDEDVVELGPGVCIRIPCGTQFQFSSNGPGPLQAVGVTMPPWPGDGEAIRSAVTWRTATVPPGPGLAER